MKVLIYNHSFFYLSETFIYRQITGLPDDIHVTLLSRVFSNDDIYPTTTKKIFIRNKVNFVDRFVSYTLKCFFKRRSTFSFFGSSKIKGILRESKFNVVHVHFGFNAIKIYQLVRLFNIPLVVSFHGIDASAEYLNKKHYKENLNDLFDYAKAIIIVSPHMIESLALAHWMDKTHLIPYGINSEEFVKNATIDTRNDIVKILHVGRVISKKGVPDLIKVCIALNEKYHNIIHLDIIGEGPECSTCKDLVETNNIKNITLWGGQTQSVVKEFMSNTDIFVLNSREGDKGDMEGFPNAIIEAMSMSLPVISTYHAGIPLAITHNVEGLLVNEKDNEALKNALEKLILDKSLRERLGKAGRNKVINEFSLEKMNTSIINIYHSVAQ